MLETLIGKAREYLPEERLGVVEEAFHYAAEAHDGQLRKSGEPFLEHPFQTAMVLADLKLDPDALAAGLLHDVVEDSPDVLIEDIQNKFGNDVARLVDGVTKFTEAELVAAGAVNTLETTHAQAETIRKMLMAMAEDIRVVLIKLARQAPQHAHHPAPARGQENREGAGDIGHLRATRPSSRDLGD